MNQNQSFEAERALIPAATVNGELAMSSRNISSETGKEHFNVTIDINKMFDALEISPLKFQGSYRDSRGKTRKEYLLTKKLTLTLVSGYSIKLRSAIIDRWQELEGEVNAPMTTIDSVRLLLVTLEEKEALTLKVTEDAPKVEFFDQVTASNTVCQMAVAAQVAKLPFGRNILMRKLRENGVLMSGPNRRNHPKQVYINQGLFTLEESQFENKKTGKIHVNFTPYVTQKGLDFLIKKYSVTSSGSQLKESGS
jgi:anti-repressor protein